MTKATIPENYQVRVCAECGGPIKDYRRRKYCSEECKKRSQKKQTAAAVRRYQEKKRNERLEKGLPVRRTRRPSTTTMTGKSWCKHYRQIITPDICQRRQGRITSSSSGMFLDGYCRDVCKGAALVPATKRQIGDHRKMVQRIAGERGYSVRWTV